MEIHDTRFCDNKGAETLQAVPYERQSIESKMAWWLGVEACDWGIIMAH